MIFKMTGFPRVLSDKVIALELNGIHYELNCSSNTVGYRVSDDGRFSYFIHEHIGEDKHDLYGFLFEDELQLFKQLLKVKGIGPKVALAVCSLGTVGNVKQMIRLQAVDALSAARGVSTEKARMICLELSRKVGE